MRPSALEAQCGEPPRSRKRCAADVPHVLSESLRGRAPCAEPQRTCRKPQGAALARGRGTSAACSARGSISRARSAVEALSVEARDATAKAHGAVRRTHVFRTVADSCARDEQRAARPMRVAFAGPATPPSYIRLSVCCVRSAIALVPLVPRRQRSRDRDAGISHPQSKFILLPREHGHLFGKCLLGGYFSLINNQAISPPVEVQFFWNNFSYGNFYWQKNGFTDHVQDTGHMFFNATFCKRSDQNGVSFSRGGRHRPGCAAGRLPSVVTSLLISP